MTRKPVLAGLLPEAVGPALRGCLENSVPDFRSRQICRWITRGARDFSEMKNLPLVLRKELSEKCDLYSSDPTLELKDKDGTVKIQITLEDGNKIEAVILCDGKGRMTACISTQAGCACACAFCKTGSLGFKRNLSAGEMAEEFLFLRQREPDISHIVIMGMGEPLLNLDELRKALLFFTSEDGLGISKKRVTVSTAGIIQGIRDLADNGPDVRLAVSLTSARQAVREKLMPVARTNPLPALRESLVYFQKKRGRRITLEAVLLKEINTTEAEAAAMAEFANSLDAVVNLIPWNPVESSGRNNTGFLPPDRKEITRFMELLEQHKIKVTLRTGKGQGISGACGQLGS